MRLFDDRDQGRFFAKRTILDQMLEYTSSCFDKRRDHSSPIPLSIKFSDQAFDIAKCVKTALERI